MRTVKPEDDRPDGVQLPSETPERPGGPEVDNELPGHGGAPDNSLPTPPRRSPRHEAGIEGPDEALPTDLRAGNMVVFHLNKDFCPSADKDTNLHRAALVNKVYATDVEPEAKKKATPRHGNGEETTTPPSGPSPAPDTKEAHVDLTVFLQQGDDPGRTFPLMVVVDAPYDSECPEGTFCLIEDGSDDLPTVGDVTTEVNPLEKKNKSGKGLTNR